MILCTCLSQPEAPQKRWRNRLFCTSQWVLSPSTSPDAVSSDDNGEAHQHTTQDQDGRIGHILNWPVRISTYPTLGIDYSKVRGEMASAMQWGLLCLCTLLQATKGADVRELGAEVPPSAEETAFDATADSTNPTSLFPGWFAFVG